MILTKANLRRAALAHRQALPTAEIAHRSQQLSDLLFQHFPVAEWRWLHVFLPIAARNEPDTWRIIRRVWAEGLAARLAVPVVPAAGGLLRHYELRPETPLHLNRWGIPEPESEENAETEVAASAFDAVLVPLLAVDATGHRVGYGAGYYDRFLAQCRPTTLFIGLSVLTDAPVPRIADVHSGDVLLTAYLTPGGLRWF